MTKRLSLFLATLLFLTCTIVRGQTVRVKIFYDLGNYKSTAASNLQVYLVPINSENKKIVNKISIYEPSCNDPLIRTAKDYKVDVSNADGYVQFENIPAGSYLLKVCTYFGAYKKFTISRPFTGTIEWPAFEADPPIK